jgi:hypothetical protein
MTRENVLAARNASEVCDHQASARNKPLGPREARGAERRKTHPTMSAGNAAFMLVSEPSGRPSPNRSPLRSQHRSVCNPQRGGGKFLHSSELRCMYRALRCLDSPTFRRVRSWRVIVTAPHGQRLSTIQQRLWVRSARSRPAHLRFFSKKAKGSSQRFAASELWQRPDQCPLGLTLRTQVGHLPESGKCQ